MTRGARVGRIEVGDVCRSMNVLVVYPTVLLGAVAFPSNQELKLAAVHTTVQNFFHHIFLVTLH